MTEKEIHTQLDNQILTYLMHVYNNMAHPHHPDPKDVEWWIDRCSTMRSTFFLCPHRLRHMRPRSIGLIPSQAANTKLSKVEPNTDMAMRLCSEHVHTLRTILHCHKRAKRCTTLAR